MHSNRPEPYCIRYCVIVFCILYATIVTVAAEPSNLNQNYSLKGICNIDGTWMLSIKDRANNQHFWLKVGQRYGDLKLSAFNPEDTTATLLLQGYEFYLVLSEKENFPEKVIRSRQLKPDELKHINQQVEKYREELKRVLLATPKSGPRRPETQLMLEQDIENAVANYRQRLMSIPESDQTDEIIASTSSGNSDAPKIIGVKRRNRVNSRIWASDHIEKYGEPDDNGKLIIEAPVSD